MATYELKTEKFAGPLEKLLELIEAKKLGVTEISLAKVTDDFLAYLRSLSEKDDMRLIADFIVVASRLILIKSKFLLPELNLTGEEEAEIKDLEKRLKFYQEFKPALKAISRLWQGKKASFGRPYFLELGSSSGVFYPGENLGLAAMVAELEKLFLSIKRLELETGTVKEKIVSLEEKIAEVVKRLEREKETGFTSLSSEKERAEIIAIFLAILHLAREQLVFLEQAGQFSDIIIRKQNQKIKNNE